MIRGWGGEFGKREKENNIFEIFRLQQLKNNIHNIKTKQKKILHMNYR